MSKENASGAVAEMSKENAEASMTRARIGVSDAGDGVRHRA